MTPLVRAAPVAATALLLLPHGGSAEELRLGVGTSVTWQDNVFGVSDDAFFLGEEDKPQDDWSLRMSPSAEVVDKDGRLTWSVNYRPSYNAYADFSELNAFDQFLGGRLAWDIAPRWRFKLSENFSNFSSATRFNDQATAGDQVALGFQDLEITTNTTEAEIEHKLTERDELALRARYYTLEYSQGFGADRDVPSLTLEWDRRLDQQTNIGTRLGWTRQSFARAQGGDNSTDFYNLALTVERRFSRRLRLEIAAGPTYIDAAAAEPIRVNEFGAKIQRLPGGGGALVAVTAEDCQLDGVPFRSTFGFSCDVNSDDNLITRDEFNILTASVVEPPSVFVDGDDLVAFAPQGGTDLNYFARVALVYNWEEWTGRLVYRRANSERARFGSSTISDSLIGSLNFRPGKYWSINLAGSLTLQNQSVDQEVPIGLELENVTPAEAGLPGGFANPNLVEVARVRGVIYSGDQSDVEFTVQSVSLGVNRVLTPRASAYARVSWSLQEQNFEGERRTWNSTSFAVGLQWNFDPIRF